MGKISYNGAGARLLVGMDPGGCLATRGFGSTFVLLYFSGHTVDSHVDWQISGRQSQLPNIWWKDATVNFFIAIANRENFSGLNNKEFLPAL